VPLTKSSSNQLNVAGSWNNSIELIREALISKHWVNYFIMLFRLLNKEYVGIRFSGSNRIMCLIVCLIDKGKSKPFIFAKQSYSFSFDPLIPEIFKPVIVWKNVSPKE